MLSPISGPVSPYYADMPSPMQSIIDQNYARDIKLLDHSHKSNNHEATLPHQTTLKPYFLSYPNLHHTTSLLMAGGALKYRHLNRSSSHRQALLRNLVTSLITHESIRTTWPKAKEAQRLAEKLITLGKKNTNASRRKAESIFFVRITPFLSSLFTTSVLLPLRD